MVVFSQQPNMFELTENDLKDLAYDENDTYDTYEYSDGEVCDLAADMAFEAIFIPILYFMAFAVGIIGNGLLLIFLLRSKKAWNVTGIFILYLSVADVLLLLTLPLWAIQAFNATGWVFGTPLCKLTGAVFTVCSKKQDFALMIIQYITCFVFFLDQFLLWDFPSGVYKRGPISGDSSCHSDVLPQKPLHCSHNLPHCVDLGHSSLRSRLDILGGFDRL